MNHFSAVSFPTLTTKQISVLLWPFLCISPHCLEIKSKFIISQYESTANSWTEYTVDRLKN